MVEAGSAKNGRIQVGGPELGSFTRSAHVIPKAPSKHGCHCCHQHLALAALEIGQQLVPLSSRSGVNKGALLRSRRDAHKHTITTERTQFHLRTFEIEQRPPNK